MAKVQHYPKMIYKKVGKSDEQESMIVTDPYHHMSLIKKGWSGPAEFDTGIEELERSIAQDEVVLEEKKTRLAEMKEAAVLVESKPSKK